MYKIIKDGIVVGITGAPTYIKMLDNGCFGLCSKEDAQGVAFDGTAYHMDGRAKMDGADTTSVVEDSDATVSRDHTAAAQVFVEQAEAGNIDVNTALEHKGLFDEWKVGVVFLFGAMRQYNAQLYKCRQEHTSQADWPPDKTPALWAVVNVSNAGTIDDPIPAERGMEYEYGKYYLDPEDGKTYLCERGSETGTIVLHYLPHELTDIYFTLV